MIAAIGLIVVAMTFPVAIAHARVFERRPMEAAASAPATAQNNCPLIFPAGFITVAPNQPAVPNQSTAGIINALCDVTLYFVGCNFTPTSVTLGCDTNGDGVSDLAIPLTNIKVLNGLLIQATIPALAKTPGTAFPLVCCGGPTTITLSRTVSAGDNNIFGPFTQTVTCAIDLGIRAPVVISATPSDGECALGQNLLIPGSCFVLSDGKPNVTSVFAVDAANPQNVIQAKAIQVLNSYLVDAFFQIGTANSGKTFLIFASGPNGTSRNLIRLPANAAMNCPLGNEQGVAVTFKCRPANPSAASTPVVNGCLVERNEAGVFLLSIFGKGIQEGATVSVGGVTPKKLKFKGRDSMDNMFTSIVTKARFCDNLPGAIVIVNPAGTSSLPVFCSERCPDQ